MADQPNEQYPTVIGADANFKGEMTFEKGLRLMGKFEGKMTSPGRLHVTREAHLQADVDAGGIVIEGEVRGNLSASDRIELKSTAHYEGDMTATKLVVDEGAVFTGHVTVGPDAVKGKPNIPSPGINRPQPQPQSQSPQNQPQNQPK
ncbi:MAG: polymer-forming cytoskeletal protein [Phycisphaerae bacterium]